jgi:hypothetical protein
MNSLKIYKGQPISKNALHSEYRLKLSGKWSRDDIITSYTKMSTGQYNPLIFKSGDPRRVPPLDTLNSLLVSNPNVTKVEYYDYGLYKYIILFRSGGTIELIIEDTDVYEIKNQLNVFSVPSIIKGDSIIIDNIDFTTYYVLDTIIRDLPSANGIYGKIDKLSYFLKNKPEFAVDYVSRNIEKFPDFLKLVENEPSYDDIILELGLKYLDYLDTYEVEFDEKFLGLADKMLANNDKVPGNTLERVLDILLVLHDSPNVQIRRDRLFKILAGLPINLDLKFDIKANAETIINLGKLYKNK